MTFGVLACYQIKRLIKTQIGRKLIHYCSHNLELCQIVFNLQNMPSLNIVTSAVLPTEAASKAVLLKELSHAVATILQKPEDYMMVTIQHGDVMMGGDLVIGANVVLSSIGGLTASNNQALSQAICKALRKHLAVASDRVYIQFLDIQVKLNSTLLT